jgi:hypothetical protein
MHGGRTAFFVDGRIEVEPPAAAGGPHAAAPAKGTLLKFGRLFDRERELEGAEDAAMVAKLVELGRCMNDPKTCGQQPVDKGADASEISSGYTYLGQFIAHEITFDNSNDTLEPGMDPRSMRTPQIDLDGLYGAEDGPRNDDYKEFYEGDGATMKVGMTSSVSPPGTPFPNDLLRDANNKKNPKKALIADERNDENLAVAQTHVAFVRFHNRVVERLKADHAHGDLFECARRQVIRHFQWIIIHDYLPKLVDNGVLARVLGGGFRCFKLDDPDGPTMPLEFSAAAFRIGHTMVRATYDWNEYHHRGDFYGGGRVGVLRLFELTGFLKPDGEFNPLDDGFSSRMTHTPPLLTLPSDWIIDWRRFYDFSPLDAAPQPPLNMASKLDTGLNFQLEKLRGFPDEKLVEMKKAITVRNLLRGYYLGLPTGEKVARAFDLKPLTPERLAEGPHGALLGDPLLREKTPLWYYVLREAELLGKGSDCKGGHRLGPVGSRIVAETLVGLVRRSPYSILDGSGWLPTFARPGAPDTFEMIDLLKFAFGPDASGENSVNPLG